MMPQKRAWSKASIRKRIVLASPAVEMQVSQAVEFQATRAVELRVAKSPAGRPQAVEPVLARPVGIGPLRAYPVRLWGASKRRHPGTRPMPGAAWPAIGRCREGLYLRSQT